VKPHYREIPVKRSPGKHATPWHRQVAEAGTILLSEVGSGLHGTSVSDYDDRDEMGICIEPPEAVIGFRRFEQYEWKTAWERPGERANRSGPGDLDLTIYSLRKWMRLAANGNPTVLLPLFAPGSKLVKMSPEGLELRERMPQYILSRTAGDRFTGYLKTQRDCMLSHEGKGRDCTRPELIERYGYDTKFAGHMVRLGLQGHELMATGKITLPMPAVDARTITAIRTGQYSMHETLAMAEILEEDIARAVKTSPLPESPDWEVIDRWLSDTYQWHWTRTRSETQDYGKGPY
jgi:hypothetical protein